MDQFFIMVTGVVAIQLSQDQSLEKWKQYACIFGVLGQPFWFYSSYMAEQWGVFILCFFYTYAWYKGIQQYWLPKLIEQKNNDNI